MERNNQWHVALTRAGLSAGIMFVITPEGRGSTTAIERGVVPFLML
ncbi:hypothetical protein GBAR_LOCUS4082 [Geodia barretti]|uniref:Uncharacterized protein n=1 Tax=Geodia barretti TaxID=519541 RepID=A0AA35R6T4_GEOBA|nr:hypothetical protein GBAR_LOCUS4082 [Geodia barretti]